MIGNSWRLSKFALAKIAFSIVSVILTRFKWELSGWRSTISPIALKSHCERPLDSSLSFNPVREGKMARENESNSTEEIEITPAMLRAGVEQIEQKFMELRRPTDLGTFEEVAHAIFVAMHQAMQKAR